MLPHSIIYLIVLTIPCTDPHSISVLFVVLALNCKSIDVLFIASDLHKLHNDVLTKLAATDDTVAGCKQKASKNSVKN